MSDEVSIFRRTDFRWLWTGQTISVVGSQIAGLAFPFLAVELLHATELQMGLLNAADTAAFLIFGLLAGAWVDRWRKRKVMIWADVIRLFATAVVPVLWFTDQLNIYHLMVVGAIVGIATVFFDVGYQSYVPILLPAEQIGSANSALETTNQIARIGGPAVVGGLLSLFAAPVLMIIDAGSYLVSAVTLTRFRDNETPKPKEERRPLQEEIREGVRFVWTQPLLRSISFCTASTNFFSTILFTLLPLFLLRDLDLSASVYGTMMSISAVGGLVGATSTAKLIKAFGEGPVIVGSAVVGGFSFLMLPFATLVEPWLAVAIVAVSGFITSFTVLSYNITQVTARQRLCPPELLGRMNASIRFFIWGVMPIAALVSGFIGDWQGILPVMWLGAIGVLLSSGFVVFSPLRNLRELPSHPERNS